MVSAELYCKTHLELQDLKRELRVAYDVISEIYLEAAGSQTRTISLKCLRRPHLYFIIKKARVVSGKKY